MTNKFITVTKNPNGGIETLTMPRPSNWHAHLRAEELCETVAPIIMQPHKYLLVMPNSGPITTLDDVFQYHLALKRMRDRCGFDTELVMTIYFTDRLNPGILTGLSKFLFRCEVKYYPPHQGATTGSGYGIPLQEGVATLRAMEEMGIPLLGHFESVVDKDGNEIPHAKREEYFLTEEYPRLRDAHPELKICIEHASTAAAVDIVRADNSGNTVLTATPHHLLFTMDELRTKSWENHGKCMPYLKTEADRLALREFVFSGDYRAIAGDDTAPHPSQKKIGSFESPDVACGCWLPHAVGLYVLAAQEAGSLNDNFVKFMCFNGADWRGLPRPTADETITLVSCASPNDIPDPVAIGSTGDVVIPLGWTEKADRLKIGHALVDQMHCS